MAKELGPTSDGGERKRTLLAIAGLVLLVGSVPGCIYFASIVNAVIP